MYELEEKKLLQDVSDLILESLMNVKGWIAGGAVTSVFCNREIKDYDLYFGSAQDLFDFLMQLEGTGAIIVNKSDKAVTITHKEKLYQAIYFQYYESPKDIFKDFDFTVCMGAYNPRKGKFILHSEFLHHNSLRILKFNAKTSFPLVSILRIPKYEEKGYTVSKLETCKMLLAVNKTKLESYEQVANAFGGMYGYKYTELFKDAPEEFSIENALEALEKLEYLEEKLEVDTCNFKEFCLSITGVKLKCFETNIGKLSIYDLDIVDTNDIELIDSPEFIYKFVQKRDGKYFSYYDSRFEYFTEGEVVPSKSNYYQDGLYFSLKQHLGSNCYLGQNKDNQVLIECKFFPDYVHKVSGKDIVVNKTLFVRELPEDEWKGWLKV